MSRQSAGQRWCSLVLLAVFLSLCMFYSLPAIAFRIGQAIEAGRHDAQVAFAPASAPDAGMLREEQAAHLARASRKVRPAVVRIDALSSLETTTEDSGAGSSRAARPSEREVRITRGCGVMIDRQGWVVTSRQVVNGASVVRVHVEPHKSPFVATIAGSDVGTDLAVLKFDPPTGGISVASLDDGEPMEVGQYVMAVGNAYHSGEFLWVGVINSCGGRASPACCNVHDCIHTTAVNAWNFGGPLLNLDGAIVGINTALREADGLPVGVAVPVATARQVVAQLRSQGQVRRGWLGVFIHKASGISGTRIPAADFPEGALAVAVDFVIPDSPAERGGIEAGDVIYQFANSPFESAVELRRRIASTAPGAQVVVKLVRDGVVVDPRVVVGQPPAAPPHLPGEREWGIRLLGHLTAAESRQLGVDHLSGVVVLAVEPHRKAAELSARDVILSVDGMATPDLEAFCRVASRHFAVMPGSKVRLEVSSSGVPKTIVIGDE